MQFWTLLAHVRERKDSLAGWFQIFGLHFDAIRPLLLPCPGQYCATYPDPQSGGKLNVTRFENRWAAFRDAETGDGPDLELTEADVLLHRLDVEGLRERLRLGLGVLGPSNAINSQLECLGYCAQGPKRRRVYLCAARNEAEALTAAQEVIGRSDADGCAVMPNLSEAVQRMLAESGVSGVHLAGGVSLTAGSVQGGCGMVCKHLADLSRRGLQRHLDDRFDRVTRGIERVGDHVRDLEAENALLKQNLVRALVDITRRVEPEFFHWILVVLAKGSVSGAANSLELKGSTFDERLKKYAAKDRIHQTLFSLVAVRRKGLGVKSIEGFNDLFLGHQNARIADDEEILRRVLDGLEALHPQNFKATVEELISLVRELLPEE